ncbi:hypothetical protein SAMN05444748_10430 [Variovorax sp. OV700]|nr:hypothetical protein SAMN05444748_10430 [Variovorax sp. OV700]
MHSGPFFFGIGHHLAVDTAEVVFTAQQAAEAAHAFYSSL